MAKPFYVQAFQHFKEGNDDLLNAYVAFALYVDAECKWAASQSTWPNQGKYKDWFECYIPHSSGSHNEKAIEVLQDFANNIVEQERIEFLAAALEQYKQEASKPEKGFWRGVAEALTGAALWTIILIGAAFILKWFNPDIYEVLGRVLGKH
jgi:thiaminase